MTPRLTTPTESNRPRPPTTQTTEQPPPPRLMKKTICNNNDYEINKETGARLTDNDVRQNLKTIHSIIVQTHLNNRPANKLFNRPPPEIDKTEETLPHSTRRRLPQLRADKSPILMTYLHKINKEDYLSQTCPLCNSNDHDTRHQFNCSEIPTDLTTKSL